MEDENDDTFFNFQFTLSPSSTLRYMYDFTTTNSSAFYLELLAATILENSYISLTKKFKNNFAKKKSLRIDRCEIHQAL